MSAVTIDLDRIKDPPVVVTIPIASRISAVADAVRAGDPACTVTAADVSGSIYAVDGLDVLLAYRQCGKVKVPCIIIPAGSEAEAQIMHVRRSQKLPTNPFSVIRAVEYIRGNGGPGTGGVLTAEHRRLERLGLSEQVRNRMAGYITALGQKLDDVPSFFHVFRELARVKKDRQAQALDSLLAYCDGMAQASRIFSVPDSLTAERILRQFAGGNAGGSRPRKAGKPDTGDSGTDPGMIQFRCGCGSEYAVNVKSRAVRTVSERSGVILLEGDCGRPVFPLRDAEVEHLGLEEGAQIYRYRAGAGKSGAVIISRRRIPEDALAEAGRILAGIRP